MGKGKKKGAPNSVLMHMAVVSGAVCAVCAAAVFLPAGERMHAFFTQTVNSQAIATVSGVVSAVCAAVTLFFPDKRPMVTQTITGNGVGYQADTMTVVNYPIEQYRRDIEDERKRIKADYEGVIKTLASVHEEKRDEWRRQLDDKRRAIDENERKLADLQGSYGQKLKEIKNLKLQIAQFSSVGDEEIKSAQEALATGDTKKAERLLKSVYAKAEKKEREAAKEGAKAAFLQGEIEYEKLNYAEAENWCARAAQKDAQNWSYANAYGRILEIRGKYGEAIAVLERAKELAERTYGEDAEQAGTATNNLALLYKHTGRYAEAEPLYKQVAEITKNSLGENHPDFSVDLNNLADLYRATGRYAEAEPLYKQASEIWKNTLGDNHPEFAKSLNNLAMLYVDTNRYAEAEPLFKQALEIWKNILGSGIHPDFAQILNNFAFLYASINRYAEAEPLYKQATEITRNVLGENHLDYAIRLNNLAGLYKGTNRYAEAEPLFKQAVEIAEKSLGAAHPMTQTIRKNYADTLACGGG